MTIFDLVYTLLETALIRAAREAGCETIPGTEMFVHQAVEQFRLITGIAVAPEVVRGDACMNTFREKLQVHDVR